MTDSNEPRKIMTKPLPQILDEIEESIKSADEAASQARKAAAEAQTAVEKAVSEATKNANERVIEAERIAREAMKLAESVKQALLSGTVAVTKRLSEEPFDTGGKPPK